MNYIENEEQLQRVLSEPNEEDCRALAGLEGDVLLLGAGGKIGPGLAVRVARAARLCGSTRRVLAVSRFSDRSAVDSLGQAGVETIECDLADRAAVQALPDARNVLFLAGRKFGSTGRPDMTWAMNTMAPAHCADRFRNSNIVVFSTGNLYPFVSASSGGCAEGHPLEPVGEYAQSCLGRERIFEYFSAEFGTPCLFFRLNYAVDLRYGVLVDIARRVRAGEPIEGSVGSFNVVWQGDVNSYAIRSLALCSSPPRILNVTGPETVSVRWAAEFFGRYFEKEPVLIGEESGRALLSNASECHALLGYPKVPLRTLVEWVAGWVGCGNRLLNKPTRFEVKDGKF